MIVTEDVYGGTYRLLTSILSRMGIESTFVDMTDLDQVKAALKPNTKAVYMETPSNPTLKITDIGAVTDWAKEHGLLTLLDNTFMTPFYQRPIEFGVDIVIHSATKFLGGHSDVLAGLAVARTQELGDQLKRYAKWFGHGAWGPGFLAPYARHENAQHTYGTLRAKCDQAGGLVAREKRH